MLQTQEVDARFASLFRDGVHRVDWCAATASCSGSAVHLTCLSLQHCPPGVNAAIQHAKSSCSESLRVCRATDFFEWRERLLRHQTQAAKRLEELKVQVSAEAKAGILTWNLSSLSSNHLAWPYISDGQMTFAAHALPQLALIHACLHMHNACYSTSGRSESTHKLPA